MAGVHGGLVADFSADDRKSPSQITGGRNDRYQNAVLEEVG
jgi:hypothetical protein